MVGPPKRHRASSNAGHTQHALPSPAPSPAPGAPAMSALSRYNHNLKVLHRRDPSIVSIFDQFSHVCVYHHDGTRWEKSGYEGTMFLYERESYPPYGFYILNRVGMDDYIQKLYPEDSMQAHDKYLMMRSYPQFTSHRLSSLSYLTGSGKFAPEWMGGMRGPDGRELGDKEKGESVTFGLWCFATDARDPMQDVMIRLHSYIKQNIPYPDLYKYAPDRNPQSNPYSSSPSPSPYLASPQITHETPSKTQPYSNNGAGSPMLDKLFSKIQPAASNSTPASNSMASLLGALNGHQSPAAPQREETPSRGLALLDSIFASATPSLPMAPSPAPSLPNPHPPSRPDTRNQHPITNTPPNPRVASHQLQPQVLTQEVLASLLGMGSSHTAYDASDEESSSFDGEGSPGLSSTSTVLDLEAEGDMSLMSAGASAGLPLLAPYGGGQSGQYGDRTPRAPLRGMDSDESPMPAEVRPYAGGSARRGSTREENSGLIKSSSSSTIRAHFHPSPPPPVPQPKSAPVPKSAPAPRTLVPFSADSELWPYPKGGRGVVNDDSTEEGEVVELDFSDMSRLSDLAGAKANGEKEKGKGKKKGKKERAEDKERERDAIEKSWDVPAPAAPAAAPVPTQSAVNGKGKEKAKPKADVGTAAVDPGLVREVILDGLDKSAKGREGALEGMGRNDFVKEVLTLIHTDKTFVDRLWREYMSRGVE